MSKKFGVDNKLKIFWVVTHGATEAATKSYGVLISKNDNRFIKVDNAWQWFKEGMTWSYVKKTFLDTLVPSLHADYKISLLSAVTPDSPKEKTKSGLT